MRRFRFSLRTLFAFVTGVAAACAVLPLLTAVPPANQGLYTDREAKAKARIAKIVFGEDFVNNREFVCTKREALTILGIDIARLSESHRGGSMNLLYERYRFSPSYNFVWYLCIYDGIDDDSPEKTLSYLEFEPRRWGDFPDNRLGPSPYPVLESWSEKASQDHEEHAGVGSVVSDGP